MIDVYLHGVLAQKYGAHHRLAIRSAREALRALASNCRGFTADMIAHQVMVYVARDKHGITAMGELSLNVSKRIDILPAIAGAGGKLFSWLQIAVGAVLMMTGVGSMLGASLIMSGAAGLLTKQPKIADALQPRDELKSFGFSMPSNTSEQGSPIPVIYGRVFTGSVVGSAGINTDRVQG